MIKERFTYERVGKESIRVFDNGKKMHPCGGVVTTLNDQDLRIKQLENEVQGWKNTFNKHLELIKFARDIIELNCELEQIAEFHKFKEKMGVIIDN